MNWKSRFYALAMHSIFSSLLLLVALFLVFKLWYPSPLDEVMGVTQIFWFILCIDLVLGPLLTFIIFNLEKKELKRDLFIIVIIQLAAYFSGLYTVAQGRPVWQVFVIDDIELVRAIDIKKVENNQVGSQYNSNLLSSPRWISAVYSTDAEIQKMQKQDEMFEGISLATRPETYQPLEQREKQIKAKLYSLQNLQRYNSSEAIANVLKPYSNKQIIGYLPVKGFTKDVTALFDQQVKPIAIVNLNPWNN